MAEKKILNLGKALPQKGTDYWTDADKTEINAVIQAYIAKELAKRGQLKPEFADSVADLKASGDTSKLYVLPDGYIYAYFSGGSEETPDTTLTMTDGVTLDTSTGAESSSASYAASNYVKIVDGYTYILTRTAGKYHRYFSVKVCYYDESKNYLSYEETSIVTSEDTSADETAVAAAIPTVSGAAYFRLRVYTAGTSAVDVFTLDAYSGSSTVKSGWCSTGHAFVPADYEDRIVALEDDTASLKASVKVLGSVLGGLPDTTLTMTDGVQLSTSTGAESSHASYSASNYVKIVDGYTYILTRTAGKYHRHFSVKVCYYDVNKSFLTSEDTSIVTSSDSSADETEVTVTIPTVNNAAYFRLRVYNAGLSAEGVFTLTAEYAGGSSGSGSETSTESNVPDYVVTEANRVISEVMQKQTNSTITFLAISDMHNLESSASIRNGNLHAGQAAKIIADSIGLDFAAMLGDVSCGAAFSTVPGQSPNDILKANQYIADAFKGVDNFRTNGNHDPLTVLEDGVDGNLTQGQMYALIGRYNHAGKSYFYRDYDGKKVRVIMLNTVDGNHNGGSGMTAAQLLWFAQSLDLSGKSDASDWQILILSHHPLDWNQYSWGTNLMNAANILAAYLAGTSVTFTEDGVTNSYNFSGKNGATIIGQIHGHLHNYKVDNIYSTLSGTITATSAKRIAIPNAMFDRNNTYAYADTENLNGIDYGEFAADGTTPLTYNKTAGTAEDTAFCVVTIDLDEKKIYAHHYGAGYDREISY